MLGIRIIIELLFLYYVLTNVMNYSVRNPAIDSHISLVANCI